MLRALWYVSRLWKTANMVVIPNAGKEDQTQKIDTLIKYPLNKNQHTYSKRTSAERHPIQLCRKLKR